MSRTLKAVSEVAAKQRFLRKRSQAKQERKARRKNRLQRQNHNQLARDFAHRYFNARQWKRSFAELGKLGSRQMALCLVVIFTGILWCTLVYHYEGTDTVPSVVSYAIWALALLAFLALIVTRFVLKKR